jgi:hypothetical protein
MRIARGISVTNTSKPISTAPAYDADATAFFTAASITDTTQKNAVNTLVLNLKSANIWTKMKALYPVVGGSSSSHAVNLKQPGTFNLSFATGWTHSSTGMTPNGGTFADTGLIPSSFLQTNSTHISFYSRTNNDTGFDIGVNSNSASGRLYMYNKLSSSFGGRNNNTTSGEKSISNTNGLGCYINNRIDSSNIKLVKNGTTTTLALTASGLDNYQITIGAVYNVSTYYYGTKECAFASIGDGLTDAEALSFYNAVQTYQTTLGRQV